MNGHDDASGSPDGNNTNFAGANNSSQNNAGGSWINDSNSTPSDASQGGIFSTPDLTISAENLPSEVTTGASTPEVAAANASANQSRIAAAFAKTDASAKQQAVASDMQIIPNSNLTSSTATSDIKLTPSKKKRSKLPLILVAVAVIICVGVAVALQLLGGNKVSVASLLRDNQESISAVEEIYSSAFYNELNVEQLFSNGVRNVMNNDLPKLINLSAALEKIDISTVKADAREEFNEIRTALAARAATYDNTLRLYNILYDALTNEDSTKLAALAELPGNSETDDEDGEGDNENSTVVYLDERFTNYLEDITVRNEIYTNYGCLTNSENEECVEYFDQYIEIIADFKQNTSIPYSVLSAYDNNAYGESYLLQNKITKLIEELE